MTALPDIRLGDGVATVRGWRDTDLRALVTMCQDPEIPRWTRVPSPYTREDGLMFLTLVAVELRAGRAAHLAIEDAGGELAGSVSLQHVDADAGTAEIGYFLGAAARGRGLATRALGLLAGHALGALGLARVEVHAAVENRASQRVAERAGFTREPGPPGRLELKGRTFEVVRFARRA